jgi:hypothetical protein
MNKYTNSVKLSTKEDWINTENCKCDKKVFKFHDSTDNVFVIKCNVTKEEFDIKTKKWIASKKKNCGLFLTFHGTPPEYQSVPLAPKEKNKKVLPGITGGIKERLEDLFGYLMLSNNSSTLQEINLLVKYRLHRKQFNKETEDYPGYRKRIFSRPIIDKSIKIITKSLEGIELGDQLETETESESSSESDSSSESNSETESESNSDPESDYESDIGSELLIDDTDF